MWSSEKELGYQILGYYGYEGGYRPGGFLESLLTTWGKADMENRIRLAVGFPELGETLAKFEMAGPELFKTWLDTSEVA